MKRLKLHIDMNCVMTTLGQDVLSVMLCVSLTDCWCDDDSAVRSEKRTCDEQCSCDHFSGLLCRLEREDGSATTRVVPIMSGDIL